MIVDDHEIVRRGIAEVIDAADDLTVVAEAATVAEATRRGALTRPDLLLVDLQLQDGTGLDVIRAVRAERPEIRAVVLTAFSDEDARAAALEAGAHAFVLKTVRGADIAAVVRAVVAGRTLLRESGGAPTGADDPTRALTPTERRIVTLIGDGLSNREIAESLGVAEKTVKNHVTSLLAKMGLQRRTQVAAWVAGHRGGHWRTAPAP
ncbi:DNA-binding response regulator, NarL/FixJ family, contains REC and HTH domains [Ruania alba]|uniref:DNA-binding response regulator, NarL/FixJ family, contains REC and HTH domains n=2 Tax=Ruania alba TaxID=648782 RepID=A0A1H5HD64_9MICO|nr:response regulator transcription factor [Ruania alba]SEE25850.1 DNA-binding response regulator, NarL/FixJ family, contains REC and HTH domains [Ruania alba]